uniref:Uncharacterized protein n=1 Tax=Macrostomum lignano TaxID=282301 RepID=A0A1I8HFC8_9PLAT
MPKDASGNKLILEAGTPVAFCSRFNYKYAILATEITEINLKTNRNSDGCYQVEVISYTPDWSWMQKLCSNGIIMCLLKCLLAILFGFEPAVITRRTVWLDPERSSLYKLTYTGRNGVKVLPSEEVLKRSVSRIGERSYDSRWNNSQDFVRWCCTKHCDNKKYFEIPFKSINRLKQWGYSLETKTGEKISPLDSRFALISKRILAFVGKFEELSEDKTDKFPSLEVLQFELLTSQRSCSMPKNADADKAICFFTVQKDVEIKSADVIRSFGSTAVPVGIAKEFLEEKTEKLIGKSIWVNSHGKDTQSKISKIFCNWLRKSTVRTLDDLELLLRASEYCAASCCGYDCYSKLPRCCRYIHSKLLQCCCYIYSKLIRCCCCKRRQPQDCTENRFYVGEHVEVRSDNGDPFHLIITEIADQNRYKGISYKPQTQEVPEEDRKTLEVILSTDQVELLSFNDETADLTDAKQKLPEMENLDWLWEIMWIIFQFLFFVLSRVRIIRFFAVVISPLLKNDKCTVRRLFDNEICFNICRKDCDCPWELSTIIIYAFLVLGYFVFILVQVCRHKPLAITRKRLSWNSAEIICNYFITVGLICFQLWIREAINPPDIFDNTASSIITVAVTIFLSLLKAFVTKLLICCPSRDVAYCTHCCLGCWCSVAVASTAASISSRWKSLQSSLMKLL